MSLTSINPATGQILGSYPEHTDAEVDNRLARAQCAAREHRRMSLAERAGCMKQLARQLTSERREHARRITQEMGKTILAAEAEIDKCSVACLHYAEHASSYLADRDIKTEASRSYVTHVPLGLVLGIMPWNFPYWQVFRWAVPAIMAGNAVLLKHASNVSGCALAIERAFANCGLSDDTFQTLLVGSHAVPRIIADPRVRAVSVTGSESAGTAVAVAASKSLKKCVLELGGSDPFIVMPSAELHSATQAAVASRIVNSGQSCIAAKRFLVHASCYDKFLTAFVDHFHRLRVGDPLDSATEVGPLVSEAARKLLQHQVSRAYAAGARLLCGGGCLPGSGYFYAPTVLADIPPAAEIHREELFGPVALVYRIASIEEAIALANSSQFGLGSSVWTNDVSEQLRFVGELDAGMTFINAMVTSDPRLPFGGVKHSGYGRELGSEGILEFVNTKTVYVS